MEAITPQIPATVPVHITEEAQSWSQLAIDRTIAAPDTGLAACIMSGGPVTGRGGMAGKCGSVAITSREDTSIFFGAGRPRQRTTKP